MTTSRTRLLAILKEPTMVFSDRYTLGVIAGATGYAFIDDVVAGRNFTAAIMFTVCTWAIVQASLIAFADRPRRRQ